MQMMTALIPLLFSLLLVYTGRADAACEATQCVSALDSNKCVNFMESEDMDCVTYTCVFDTSSGMYVLQRDENQEKRCSINGHCYRAGEGPDSCNMCLQNSDGSVGVSAGCLGPNDTCVPPDATFQHKCDLYVCLVERGAVDVHFSATLGCEEGDKCYKEGKKTLGYTCSECSFNTSTNMHEWYRKCRDPRYDTCFEEGSVYDIYCRTFICANRGGIGWHRHSGAHCQISQYDCITVNSTSLRDGYCYYCDEDSNGVAQVGCLACGECLRPGESTDCDGDTVTCGTVTNPPPGVKVCTLGEGYGQVQENETTTDGCNEYECTKYGLKRLTDNCIFQGECYSQRDLIDSNYCVKCSDGLQSGYEQGCRYNGKCYFPGERISYYCTIKECISRNGGSQWVDTEFQPTPCRSGGNCYRVGPFTYANDRLCGVCNESGNVEYSCRLRNGECLAVGEEEQEASIGCYRMQCALYNNTYTIEKAPGQPYRCLTPGGDCLAENETRTIGQETYVCIKGDVCIYKNQTVPVGDSIEDECHVLVCEEAYVQGVKTFNLAAEVYGCPYLDKCVNLTKTYEEDCNIYKCTLQEGNTFARPILEQERCNCDGFCLDVGQFYWTPECLKRVCYGGSHLHVAAVGCKTSQAGVCVEPGQSLTINGQTETCPENNNNATTGGSGGNVSACFVNGTRVPYGDTYNTSCNTYRCETRNNVFGLYIEGTPQCRLVVGGNPMCFDKGTSLYCFECNYNADNVTKHFEMPRSCIGDNGICVPPGEVGPYQCGTARCNGTSYEMELVQREECWFYGDCISPGQNVDYNDNGVMKQCTCGNPVTNQFQCQSAP